MYDSYDDAAKAAEKEERAAENPKRWVPARTARIAVTLAFLTGGLTAVAVNVIIGIFR